MMTKKFLIQLDKRLRDIFDPNKPFGGKSIIYVGDLHQVSV